MKNTGIKGIVGGVYKIEDVMAGEVYVGSANARQGIAKRWSNNLAKLRKGTHPYFQEAWNDDPNRIKFEIFETVDTDITDEELSDLELKYFAYVKRVDGWTLVNKQQHKASRHSVKDTSKMKLAQQNSNNGNCKLSDDDVREIRRLHSEGVKNVELAEMFNVNKNYISMIVTGKKRGEVK